VRRASDVQPTYKNEREIIDLAASQENGDVCFYPKETELVHRLFRSLRGSTLSHRERPDFEDLTNRLIIEVMIVDDHPRPMHKDVTRQRESAMLREIRESGLAELFPNASLAAISDTGLPTEEDHNYEAYLKQFASIVDKHARNVDVYRNQRPGFELAFLLLDESTAYFETTGKRDADGPGRPHFHFADDAFMNVLKRSGADCVAWLTPYKYLNTDRGRFPLPGLSLVDVDEIGSATHEQFEASRMRSAEL
jgi:hypothetical protein